MKSVRRTSLFAVIGCAVALALGCGSSDSGSPTDAEALSCEDLDLEFGEWINSELAERQACTTVDDCTKIAPSIECDAADVTLDNCDMPIAKADVKAFFAAKDAFADELCAKAKGRCYAGPSCIETRIDCVEFKCVQRLLEP